MLGMTEPLKVKAPGRLFAARHEAFCRAARFQGYGFSWDDDGSTPDPPDRNRCYPAIRKSAFCRGARFGPLCRVDVADPGFGNRTMSVESFETVWQNGIGFVVTK
jgi:hypothetical protein